jgi:putative colanic acid biosysnthesis UDP-glucose lipid carrier transferase
MFQNKYNRIALPFFFFVDTLFIFLILNLNFFLFDLNIVLIDNIFTTFLWILSSLYFKSYQASRVNSIFLAIKPMLNAWCIFALLYILLGLIIGLINQSSLVFYFSFLFSALIFQLITSYVRYQFFHNYRLKGKNFRTAVFLGDITDEKYNIFVEETLHYGFLFIDKLSESKNYLKNLELLIKDNKIDLIFIHEFDNKLSKIINFCDDNGIRLKLLLDFSGTTASRVGLDSLGGFSIMDVRHEPLLYLGNQIFKRLIDIIISIISIILVLTWLPIIIKIIQYLTYPGPLFFIQDRIGSDGKTFKLYKFRTMKISDETIDAKKGNSKKTSKIDDRVSPFGKILRLTNLDEYPQFINVLFGSMSTVGPRPHMVGEDLDLSEKIPRYRIRRFVKPGITGWSAVNGFRGGTNDLDLMTKRTELDIWYLENWTFWLDFKIIFITFWQMVTFRIPKAY